MVYLNDQKFACESCIKGHRSSSCNHTDRPLFEIKKKGRPVSQCTTCRQLRQSKKLHSKCTCVHKQEAKEATQPLAASSTSKTRRFIPIVPALPNGLRDVVSHSTPQPPDESQTVNSLRNSCNCNNPLKCICTPNKSPPQHRVIATGLSALANAAATMQAIQPSRAKAPSLEIGGKPFVQTRTVPIPPCKHLQSDRSSIHLPPLTYAGDSSSSGSAPRSKPVSMPDFGIMPPTKHLASVAGSECTCGVRCACPGCVDHKGGDPAPKKCGDGCGSCVDPTLEFSLPTGPMAAGSSSSNSNSNNTSKESFLDRFFACAAALPPPPEHRWSSIRINPMDTTVYPNGIGPPTVNLPKLECCGGRCTCPEGQCSCKKSCVACGDDEEAQHGLPFQRLSVPIIHSNDDANIQE